MSKKITWHKIADSINEINFSSAGLAETNVAGKKICLSKKESAIAACAAKCPHAGGTLADGYIDVHGNIVCPLHRYRFNLQNGRNTSGEGYYLKLYATEIRDDGVYVGIESTSLFGW
jgi:3-phenylpropionate/trans-cinnamate dioxygenase ferredoxin subunit